MSHPEQASYASAGVQDNFGYGQPAGSAYAHWGKRVGATLVDVLTQVPFYVLIVIVAVTTHSSHTVTLGTSADGTPATVEISDGISGTGFALIGLIYVALLAFGLWNLVFRQGRTGRSIGKSVLGIKLVKESTGDVPGAGLTFGRQICHIVDSFFLLGYLWPLWDDKRQTFADKICSTVVLDRKD
jgi:uncharacterized RDD family membrane protein YckC